MTWPWKQDEGGAENAEMEALQTPDAGGLGEFDQHSLIPLRCT
jgi:hypothetical protein